MRRSLAILALAGLVAVWPAAAGQDAGSAPLVRFAVIGDNGTGKTPQYELGARLAAARASFPFEFVLMVGDNLYGRQKPADYVDKFERPYAALVQAGVPFYAALGNHDEPASVHYRFFNMGAQRYYTFVKGPVRFVVLDTNLMDQAQLAWFEATLGAAREPWKIVVFHHPIYSDGARHGSDMELRALLEPPMVRAGVNVVLSGHDHFYQRVKPQQGITYFVEGSSGQLRKGGVTPTAINAVAFADDLTFMLVEIAGDRLVFQTITRDGRIVDAAEITRAPERPRSPS
jgi:3',5'-cyclic AMP phosphodiesterase CpdA